MYKENHLFFHYFLSVVYIDARRLTVERGADIVAVGVVVAHGAAGVSCLNGTDARGAANTVDKILPLGEKAAK